MPTANVLDISTSSTVTFRAWANNTNKLVQDVASLETTKANLSGATFTGSVSADSLRYTRSYNLAANTDLNTITTSGFYDILNPTNGPGTGWWYVEVQRHTNTNGHCLQRAVNLTLANPTEHIRAQVGNTWNSWVKVWNANNDGASSGMDADLLDGQHGSYYQNADNLNAGFLQAARFNDTSHGSRGGGSLHVSANSTIAGFMSTTDKTKLDGIETGATGDQTASEILTKIKTVDGSGSGLDADLVRNTTPGTTGLQILAGSTVGDVRTILDVYDTSHFTGSGGAPDLPSVYASMGSITFTATTEICIVMCPVVMANSNASGRYGYTRLRVVKPDTTALETAEMIDWIPGGNWYVTQYPQYVFQTTIGAVYTVYVLAKVSTIGSTMALAYTLHAVNV